MGCESLNLIGGHSTQRRKGAEAQRKGVLWGSAESTRKTTDLKKRGLPTLLKNVLRFPLRFAQPSPSFASLRLGAFALNPVTSRNHFPQEPR